MGFTTTYVPKSTPGRLASRAISHTPARAKKHTPGWRVQVSGLRYYNPGIGRWPSRDPIAEQGGKNLYAFVLNRPSEKLDAFGLWGYTVHYGWTRIWGVSVGLRNAGAMAIAQADEAVDSTSGGIGYYPSWIPFVGGDQSYHFNRNKTGVDSRLRHYAQRLSRAKAQCSWQAPFGYDEAYKAAGELGTGLHARQDWVAHGDYGINDWPFYYGVHNAAAPPSALGPVTGLPDRLDLDAIGSADGRPASSAMIYVTVSTPSGGSVTHEYAEYTPGTKRKEKTEELTREGLNGFLNYVRQNAKPCGKCRELFLKDTDPRRWH